MRKLRHDKPFPTEPSIISEEPMSDEDIITIRIKTSISGAHDTYNAFKVEGESNKWGQSKRFEVSSIRAVESDAAGGYDIFLETADGESFPHEKCSGFARYNTMGGIVIKDERGRGWLFREDGEGSELNPVIDKDWKFSGNGEMSIVSLETSPVVKMFSFPDDPKVRLDKLPTFAGRFNVGYHNIMGTQGPIQIITAGDDHLMAGLDRANQRIDEIIARENKIEDAIAPHINAEVLNKLFQFDEAKARTGVYPAHNAPERREFEKREHDFALKIAIALRDAGLCAKCPNGGDHNVRGIKAWNAFMDGHLDEPITDRNNPHYYRAWELSASPLFQTVTNSVIRGSIDAERDVWASRNPGEKYEYSTKVEINGDDIPVVLKSIADELHDSLVFEDDAHLISSEFNSVLDEKLRFHMLDSFLTPVLAKQLPDGRKEIFEPEEGVASIRHLEIPLPSGRLVMADHFRIPGFNEGLESIVGDDYYGINHASGLDERCKDYFEKLGMVIVQVGNTSPSAWTDTPGIWRMGTVFEDDDHFWAGDDRNDNPMPDEAWMTCTDRWSNVFADAEVIKDILMASGQYEDREAAEVALVDYAEGYGVGLVEINADSLHVYMPTGFCYSVKDFNKEFDCDEVERRDWQDDHYVLSTTELSVPENALEDHNWTCGQIDPEISKRTDDTPEPY